MARRRTNSKAAQTAGPETAAPETATPETQPQDATVPPTPAEKPSPKGVRPGRTSAYKVGQIIKRFGLDAGVTDEMVTALNELRDKPDSNAKVNLTWAWHVINAWTEQYSVEEA